MGRHTPRGRGDCGRPWAARLSDSFPPKHSASSLPTSQGSTVLSSKQNHCPPDGPCPCCFRTWRTTSKKVSLIACRYVVSAYI